ncbi:MAG: transposase [bacterium]
MSLFIPKEQIDCGLQAFFNTSNKNVAVAVRRSADFFKFFATTIHPLLEAYRDDLNLTYCANNGRPAEDPVLLLGVLALQFVERTPDRQAATCAQYDLRWRLALHLGSDACGFDPSLLTRFRTRLVKGGLERVVFEAILERLVTDGWVPKRAKQNLMTKVPVPIRVPSLVRQ